MSATDAQGPVVDRRLRSIDGQPRRRATLAIPYEFKGLGEGCPSIGLPADGQACRLAPYRRAALPTGNLVIFSKCKIWAPMGLADLLTHPLNGKPIEISRYSNRNFGTKFC